MPETTTRQKLIYFRQKMTKRIGQLQEIESELTPPAVQEVVLARRALEDARMRAGVAMAYIDGKNPWESNNPNKSGVTAEEDKKNG